MLKRRGDIVYMNDGEVCRFIPSIGTLTAPPPLGLWDGLKAVWGDDPGFGELEKAIVGGMRHGSV